MMAQRRRRWANIGTTMDELPVVAVAKFLKSATKTCPH